MSQYYFVASALPILLYDSETTLDHPTFLAFCREWLSNPDYAAVEQAVLVPPADLPAVLPAPLGTWFATEIALRNEVVQARAQRSSIDGFPFQRPAFDSSVAVSSPSNAVRAAVQETNPLTAEDILNRYRWAVLDDLQIGHYFDVSFLMVFSLKLQIIQRRRLLSRENGTTVFEAQYASYAALISV